MAACEGEEIIITPPERPSSLEEVLAAMGFELFPMTVEIDGEEVDIEVLGRKVEE